MRRIRALAAFWLVTIVTIALVAGACILGPKQDDPSAGDVTSADGAAETSLPGSDGFSIDSKTSTDGAFDTAPFGDSAARDSSIDAAPPADVGPDAPSDGDAETSTDGGGGGDASDAGGASDGGGAG